MALKMWRDESVVANDHYPIAKYGSEHREVLSMLYCTLFGDYSAFICVGSVSAKLQILWAASYRVASSYI